MSACEALPDKHLPVLLEDTGAEIENGSARSRKPGEVLYRGAGCRRCRGSGYRGRTGLFELMVANESIREKIMARSSSEIIAAAAIKGGMQLLRQDGWRKVREGVTTPEEITRATSG